jgi:hypothetical protein
MLCDIPVVHGNGKRSVNLLGTVWKAGIADLKWLICFLFSRGKAIETLKFRLIVASYPFALQAFMVLFLGVVAN